MILKQKMTSVENVSSHRFTVAIDSFKEGVPLNYKDIYITFIEDQLICAIESQSGPGMITEEGVQSSLAMAKTQFKELCKSPTFKDQLDQKPIYTVFYDYGIERVEVAREVEGEIFIKTDIQSFLNIHPRF